MIGRRLSSMLGATALVLAVVGEARAFCRARGCNPDEETCVMEDGCVVTGPELRWPDRCVTIGIHRDASPRNGIEYEAFEGVVRDAFRSWEELDCGSGRGPSIHFEVMGPVACDPHGEVANVIAFRDDEWPYVGGQDELGHTLITYDAETGEIQEVDIELNGTEPLALGGASGYDLASVVTHEAGHLLGLDHSTVEGATMGPRYHAELDTLEPDDVAGVCAIYAPVWLASEAAVRCELAPNACVAGDFPAKSPNPLPEPPLCSTSPGRRVSGVLAACAWFFSALALFWSVRRRGVRAR